MYANLITILRNVNPSILKTLQHPPNLLLIAVGTVGFITLLTYPTQINFPVSHEAPNYILPAIFVAEAFSTSIRAGITELATNSLYPATIGALAIIHAFLPILWPTTIIWLTVFMHLAIGIALALIAYRLRGELAAATTLIFWIATFTIMRPIENGWLAFWWSLLPTTLALERAIRRNYLGTGAWSVVAGLTHPLSAIILVFTFLIALPTFLLQEQRVFRRLVFGGLIFLAAASATWWITSHYFIFLQLKPAFPPYFPVHLVSSPIAFALFLAPIGLLWILREHTLKHNQTALIAFTMTIILFSFNFLWLGDSIHEWRFEPYFLLILCLAAGIGTSLAIQNLTQHATIRHFLVSLIVVLTALSTWHTNVRFFEVYDGNNPLVPYAYELDSLNWLIHNTAPDAHIVTLEYSLIHKWIPIVTNRRWTGADETWSLYQTLINRSKQAQAITIKEANFSHFVLWRDRVGDADIQLEAMRDFPTVYDNGSVIIKSLAPVYDK